ncbi:MAG: hypothetical protein ACKVOE_04560 [Rickettsiales bacterium]
MKNTLWASSNAMHSNDAYSANSKTRFVTRHVARLSESNRKLGHGSIGAILIAGGEPFFENSKDIVRYASLTPKAKDLVKASENFIKVFWKEMDKRFDSMQPEEILGSGAGGFGTTPCEFLQNPDIVTPSNWKIFSHAVDSGLYTKDELTILLNLMAETVIEGANAAVKIKAEPFNPEFRQELAVQHLRSAELSAILLTHVYKKRSVDSEKDVRFEDWEKIYPNASRMGRVLEYYDDILDIFDDLRDERRTGNPNANTIIAEYYQLLSKKQPEIRDECLQQLNNYLDSADAKHSGRFTLNDMPSDLRLALYEVIHKSERELSVVKERAPHFADSVAYHLSLDMISARLRKGWDVEKPVKATAQQGR